MFITRLFSPAAALGVVLYSGSASLKPSHIVVKPPASPAQQCPAMGTAPLPLKYKARPTVAAITACDLMSRSYIYSDDSMMGRRVGTEDNIRATAYIEREVRRLGLKPAGDSGGYFQYLPVIERRFDSTSAISVSGKVFRPGTDFVAFGQPGKIVGETQSIFGGNLNDTTNVLSAELVRGKVLVLRGGSAFIPPFLGRQRGVPSPARAAYNAMLGAAAAVLTTTDNLTTRAPTFGGTRGGPTGLFEDPVQPRAVNPPSLVVHDRVAQEIFGGSMEQLAKGSTGKPVAVSLKMFERVLPTRNVVAILPGRDPKLRGEYVAIGAHNDHNGYTIGGAVEHDSLKAYNIVARVEGADTRGAPPPTEAQWKLINAIKDSLRAIYPARMDSIQNGADDDGSGSVTVLEIAEAFAKAKVKPKRSIIFVWHTGEEAGLWGSQWFTNHPTVPRDSIVAQLNMDMVGRGAATDTTGQNKAGGYLHGGPGYLQLVGSRRLSTELGDIVEQVNKTERPPLDFDYAIDANGHPQRIYCRSDHYNYARYGIPITFFTTGGHADYHQNTDEPQYIQYKHMTRVSQLVHDVAVKVANLDHRVVVDKPKPDNPFAACVQ
jgi:hypothetical protein